ncbi:MAG: hypothetical protein ACE5KZ_01710 [Candidatus Scalinduaceae bacterium]
MVGIEKEQEKRNFINWYCWYATPEDIEKAKKTNKAAVERLTNEYAYEIEKINRSRHLFEYTSHPKGIIRELHPISCL